MIPPEDLKQQGSRKSPAFPGGAEQMAAKAAMAKLSKSEKILFWVRSFGADLFCSKTEKRVDKEVSIC